MEKTMQNGMDTGLCVLEGLQKGQLDQESEFVECSTVIIMHGL